MKKGFSQLFKRDRTNVPAPLMPGEAVDGEFEYELEGDSGKRYDLARAHQRSLQLANARETLGLDEEDAIIATLDDADPGMDEAAEG